MRELLIANPTYYMHSDVWHQAAILLQRVCRGSVLDAGGLTQQDACAQIDAFLLPRACESGGRGDVRSCAYLIAPQMRQNLWAFVGQKILDEAWQLAGEGRGIDSQIVAIAVGVCIGTAATLLTAFKVARRQGRFESVPAQGKCLP